MIKLETHCHIFGTSSCATTPNDLLISRYKEKGYGAILVTNHFSKHCYNNYFKGDTHKQKIDYFFELYDNFAKECKLAGIKTFFGAEIRTPHPKETNGTEFTVLGFNREVFYREPLLFTLSQQELFDLANENKAFMYQTHPFREGVVVGNPKYLHGAESFNGHFHHRNSNEKAEKFCSDNNLICMSGTDFHHEDQPITAGIYIPEDLSNEKDLVKFLFENKFNLIEEKQEYLDALKSYKGE
ncbi:MAG: hypothetical protein IJD54_04095 [Clostridia bacterium]|nr:hypothetical protein [Clostridia bacterium]